MFRIFSILCVVALLAFAYATPVEANGGRAAFRSNGNRTVFRSNGGGHNANFQFNRGGHNGNFSFNRGVHHNGNFSFNRGFNNGFHHHHNNAAFFAVRRPAFSAGYGYSVAPTFALPTYTTPVFAAPVGYGYSSGVTFGAGGGCGNLLLGY